MPACLHTSLLSRTICHPALAFLMVILPSGMKAQTYTPFYLDQASWTMRITYPTLGAGDTEYYWRISTTGDTVVDNVTWRKVVITKQCQVIYYAGQTIVQSVFTPNDFTIGAIREEDRRIYFLKSETAGSLAGFESTLHLIPPGEVVLLYDYHAQPGDTVHFNYPAMTFPDGDTVVVEKSTFTIIRQTAPPLEGHARLEVTPHMAFNYPYETGYWVEGIGSSYGLFGTYNSFLTSLICFSIGGTPLVYSQDCDPCAPYTSIRIQDALSPFQIFPNPATGFTYLKGLHAPDVVQLIGPSGGVLRTWMPGSWSDGIELDLDGVPPGYYWLMTVLAGQPVRPLPLVVQAP